MAITSLLPALADDVAIQRYDIIGTTESGHRLAIMLTHFGPSSQAPFANIYIYEAGKGSPVFHDGAFLMEGSEAELAFLAKSLFEKNISNLKTMGIDFISREYGDANFVFLSHSPSIQGEVDIEGVGLKSFEISTSKAISCDMPNTQINLRLSGQRAQILPEGVHDCLEGPVQLRTIKRTRSALWFIMLKQFDSLGIRSYAVKVSGLAWNL